MNRWLTYRSEATMKIRGFTARYFPFPQPTSRPTEPSGKLVRNCRTIGHGCHRNKQKSVGVLELEAPHLDRWALGYGFEHTLYLVDEKWDAITSYTWCTWRSSYDSESIVDYFLRLLIPQDFEGQGLMSAYHHQKGRIRAGPHEHDSQIYGE